MAQTFTQSGRNFTVTTPLATDVLLFSGLVGEERINGLFHIRVDLVAALADASKVKFESLLGKPFTVSCNVFSESTSPNLRYFNGICRIFSEGHRDETFNYYQAEIVPQVWVLTRQTRSRIFQQKSVVDILKLVFTGFDVQYSIQGTFEPREYCVQYRESDFDFASRLMEEEGIFYFFKHTDGGHTMVLTNSGLNYPTVPGVSTVKYDVAAGGEREAIHIHEWTKSQELRSGKTTLWDNNFQLPNNNLQAQKPVAASVQSGTVTHQLSVGGNAQFELYDYPGGYAKRFDGIDHSGTEQAASLQKIFQDNTRTVGLRMEEDAARALFIHGQSNCLHFVAGHKFTLAEHFDGAGDYIVSRVEHKAEVGTAFRSGDKNDFTYTNAFECFPSALVYRPARVTPQPSVRGVQTAMVVGPSGEEIFTDKYGRVKVQFNWDRDGQQDANSSCWLRVATAWAGKQWGTIHIPRVGMEVLVDFVEGDVDSPIVVGSVYNPSSMPPYTLPDNKTRSTVMSRSTMDGGAANFNEIRFEDKKGSEQLFINAEMDLDFRTEHDARHYVGNEQHVIVVSNRKEQVQGNAHAHIQGDHVQKIDQSASLKVAMARDTKIGTKDAVEAGTEIHIKSGATAVIEAGAMLTLKVGGNFICIGPSGVTIQGTMVMINSGGAAGSGSDASPTDPDQPDTADDGSEGKKLK